MLSVLHYKLCKGWFFGATAALANVIFYVIWTIWQFYLQLGIWSKVLEQGFTIPDNK